MSNQKKIGHPKYSNYPKDGKRCRSDQEQSDQGLYCLPRLVNLKTSDHYKQLSKMYKSHVMRKPDLCHMQIASAQSDLCLCCSLLRKYNTCICYIQNFKTLASLCSWAGRFASYLVANPEDRFSHDMAHNILGSNKASYLPLPRNLMVVISLVSTGQCPLTVSIYNQYQPQHQYNR